LTLATDIKELFVCDVRVSFRFDGLAVVNVAHLLISTLNITMSQRKSVLYVSNITSTVSGVSLGKFIGIKYQRRALSFDQHRFVDTLHHAC
jgi:hypothetical protein